ncbi:MAG: hypothetical protein ACOYK6_02950 [Chthoniobacterales bacterium]
MSKNPIASDDSTKELQLSLWEKITIATTTVAALFLQVAYVGFSKIKVAFSFKDEKQAESDRGIKKKSALDVEQNFTELSKNNNQIYWIGASGDTYDISQKPLSGIDDDNDKSVSDIWNQLIIEDDPDAKEKNKIIDEERNSSGITYDRSGAPTESTEVGLNQSTLPIAELIVEKKEEEGELV